MEDPKRPWYRWPRRQAVQQPEPPQRVVPGVHLPAPDDELSVDLAAVREDLDRSATAGRVKVTYDDDAAARRWLGVSSHDTTEWQRQRLREQYGLSADLPDPNSNRTGWRFNGHQTANSGTSW